MTDRPIIFSAPMVRALLDGRKSQTRRVLKPQPPGDLVPGFLHVEGEPRPRVHHGRVLLCQKAPYAVGDRLWVREAFVGESSFNSDVEYEPPHSDWRPTRWVDDADWGRYWTQAHYRASDNPPELSCGRHEGPCCHWKPSIHMPRWASRLTLIVTGVKVERLQEISEGDAIDEGLSFVAPTYGIPGLADSWSAYSRHGFMTLWNSINGPGAWDANPWVVALTFTVHKANIDQMQEAA